MSLQVGRVESFDVTTGEGVLRLISDGGVVPVRFDADVCRGVVPAPGVMVLAGLLGADPGSGGPLSDTFAMRAGLVEPDRGAGDVEVVQTLGIDTPRPGSRSGKLLVPFDESAFQLDGAFPEELLGDLAFGPPSPATRALPPQLRLLSGLLAVSRRASRFKVVGGEPLEGATFAGGKVADLGDRPWPKGKKGPALPLLQVGLEDARRIGLEAQINVFANGKDLSSLQVLVGQSGRRATIEKSLGEVACLEFLDEVSVFPERATVELAWRSVDESPPLDLDRFWSVEVAPPSGAGEHNHSIQPYIAKYLPSASDLEADFVLGGFAELGGDLKRLATFFTPLFPWQKSLDEAKGALEVSLDDGEATLRGVYCPEPGFETWW